MNTRITVKFLGGVADGKNLTGSCILLLIEHEKKITRTLIDIGLIQSREDFLERNKELLNQLNPKTLDSIILTHSHIDHIGRLPLLIKYGFGERGRIICTKATSGLLSVMLEDSARIQMVDIGRLKSRENKKNSKKAKNFSHSDLTLGNYERKKWKKHAKNKTVPIESLYTMLDVKKACNLIKNDGIEYFIWIKLANNISLKLYPSGHVLGGAICVIKIKTKTKDVYLGFSGDLGRQDGVILPPPEMIQEPIDYWFIESTYGGKIHPPREEEINKLISLIRKAQEKKQKIIIPSFALERAQEIIFLLSYYIQNKKISPITIYLDSPMAAKITEIFAANWQTGMFLGQEKLKFNPFDIKENKFLKIIGSWEDSEALIASAGPYIAIAGSGMCNAGRIREHLRAGLGRSDTVICLVGYMAEDSLGKKLKDGLPIVKMNNEEIIVKAEIVSFDSFSAHADSTFLVSYTNEVMAKNPDDTKKIFIIHGEEMSAAFLKLALLDSVSHNQKHKIVIPKMGEEQILL
ncbi:MAG: MBL fold metallo-hydrolase [Patescibacteria group bacterium]|jgi:metallo-beta-lactamase family protein